MAMNNSYLTLLGNVTSNLTHIGLVDSGGTEITGGSYARQSTTWTNSNGVTRLNADKVFNIPAGANVAGWRAYTASTGGTNHGGGTLAQENYTNAGTYTLQASNTGINHTAGT
jgi:hypothetical protein